MSNRYEDGIEFVGIPEKFDHYWSYWEGPNGLGGFTTRADSDGWFYSFWCKPTGKGARNGTATKFKYVPRTLSKRRTSKAVQNRSINLAQGLAITDGVKKAKKPKESNPPGTGYCMKEKKSVIMDDVRTVEAKNGRTMIQGQCPDCGTLIHKYGKVAHCPECDTLSEMSANDYICKACRTTQ